MNFGNGTQSPEIASKKRKLRESWRATTEITSKNMKTTST